MFILVIWQKHSGTDESGAGRSCFAIFPLPHCRGFSQDRLSSCCPCCFPCGALVPGMGGAIAGIGGAIPAVGERSLGWEE